MAQWIESVPTMHLRWIQRGTERVLQQKWKITRGGMGKVEYTEEWRDVVLESV